MMEQREWLLEQSGRRWTPEQRQAILARGGAVLVSAAAGSGKTSVLVERVVSRILDPVEPVDADRLLIVTFSNAAAAEMRERIAARLGELSAARPGDQRLRRQQLLVQKAQISTIHAFCLELIREHFPLLDISPDFRVADDSELAIYREEAAQECIEEYYQAVSREPEQADSGLEPDREPAFRQLVELLSSGRDDSKLKETVYRLYDFVRSCPFPDRWFEEKLHMYAPGQRVLDTPWGRCILEYAREGAAYAAGLLEEGIRLMEGDPALEKAYLPAFDQDLAMARRIGQRMDSGSWDEIRQAFQSMAFAKLKPLRGYEDEERKARVQQLRKQASDILSGLADRQFGAGSEADFAEDLEDLYPKLEVLFDLTRAFSRRLDEKKAQRRLMDFSDMEQFALRLLVEPVPGGYRPTELARETALRFDEILIDEYQDTNQAQELIFSAIARDASGTAGEAGKAVWKEGDNRFMVGDVKQSIYRFRQAMPEIFLAKRRSFARYDPARPDDPAQIILGRNFRSREGVAQGVNFVFSQLMSEDIGEMVYGEEDWLIPAAQYPENAVPAVAFHLIDTSALRGERTKEEQEGDHIAREILRMTAQTPPCAGDASGADAQDVQEGPEFVTQDGVLRPVRYGDICILLRSKGQAEVIADCLRRRGIPVWLDSQSGFLDAREIVTVLSLLRAVDNPLLDIPLAGAMLSELFRFTPDELAALRLERSGRGAKASGSRRPLYLAVLAAAETDSPLGVHCRAFVEQLGRFRTLASTVPTPELIQRIYDETDFEAAMLALEEGRLRCANLRLLVQYAGQYEKNGYKGLWGFVRYLDRICEQGSDLAPAAGGGAGDGAVKVMSIHRSKGLEFPVVFLADTARRFNRQDATAKTLLHARLGFSCVRRDLTLNRQFTTIPQEATRLEIERSSLSEELRVLYVAMTRARERLIITAAMDSPDKKLEKLSAALPREDNPVRGDGESDLPSQERPSAQGSLPGKSPVPPYLVRSGNSYADWLLMALLRHPDAGALRDSLSAGTLTEPGRWEIRRYTPVSLEDGEGAEQEAVPVLPDEELYRRLLEAERWQYPHRLATEIPSKRSVSEIVREEAGQERERFWARPAFLERRGGLTAAQRGTALHTFMQFADYGRAAEDPGAEIRRLVERGYLTAVQGEAVEAPRLAAFFASPLYGRIARSSQVLRELRFLDELPASELGYGDENASESGAQERITVQGIADCVFLEEGRWYIVDYKTDAVQTPQALLYRYGRQLELYARILSRSFPEPVGGCILYSFGLGREIEL